MSDVPSIKGSVFSYHVDRFRKLVSAGKISQEELARRLEPGDMAILDGPIHATQWYDMSIYERIVMLRRDVEGDGSNDCLLRFGAESADRLLNAGLYQQLDYLSRTQLNKETDARARFLAFGRDLRLLTTLNANIWNFGRIEVKVDPEHDDRYLIEISEASAYSEIVCWISQGFMNQMATVHGEPDLWRWERPAPDRVIYRMNRSV